MQKTIRLWDRSRTTTDWTCPRKRYLQYELDGKGIQSETESLYLFTGTVLHDCLATIALAEQKKERLDISAVAKSAFDQMYKTLRGTIDGDVEAEDVALEQATLLQGMVLGFYKHVWPRLLAEFPEVLFVEKEVQYDHEKEESEGSSESSLLFMAKPDLVLSSPSGEAVYVEYKSTVSKKEAWISSWDTAVQLHSTLKAIKQTTGVEVNHVIIQGLYKGYVSYGKQNSPFCYAYRRGGTPPFNKDEFSYEYRPGFRRYPTWELEGGVEKWVNGMSAEILSDQFPRTPPIFVNDHLVKKFFDQRVTREMEIWTALDELAKPTDEPGFHEYVMDKVFPQKWDACQPAWGSACEFRKVCHGVVSDPLKEGFEYREPHHALEAEQWKQGKSSEAS